MPRGSSTATTVALSLPQLQNLIKRDPQGYEDEFRRRWRHFQSVLELQRQQPTGDSKELVANVSFISHVAPCFPTLVTTLPNQLASLLEEQHDALSSELRSGLLQGLILLRNRGLMAPLELLQLCFRLFRCRDKALRKRLVDHVVADLKLVNLKRKDMQLNKALQNYVITMLSDASQKAAQHSLHVVIQMYRRGIWRDAKTVNVVATALFCPHPKLRLGALHFLLGAHDLAADDADSDEEEAVKSRETRLTEQRESLGKDGATSLRNKAKRKRALKRAARAAKSHKNGKGEDDANGAFAAIHLLHDPHSLAEKLLSELRKSTERFEVRLLMMSLCSRLIGAHRLMLPAFYPYAIRYMQPHQREVTNVLASCVQASHELVPPETLSPVLTTLVTHFVSDRSRPEVITLGLNTVRELCLRVPLAMDATLLADLIEYRKDKDRGVVAAARGLLQLYRDRLPELLPKKYRGKGVDLAAKPAAYGAVAVSEGVEGVELLADREARLRAKGVEVNPDAEDEWRGHGSDEEDESDDDDDDSGGESGGEESSELEMDDEEAARLGIKFDEAGGEDGEEASGEEGEEAEEEDEEDEEDEADDDDEEEGEEVDEGEEADSEESDEEGGEEDDDEQAALARMAAQQAAAKAKAKEAAPAAPRLDMTRLLTPKDFERLERLKAQRAEAQSLRGAKRKRAEAALEEEAEEEAIALAASARAGGSYGFALEGEAVNEMDIRGVVAKTAATREEKLASTLKGREDRGTFGGGRGHKKTGGKSNIEKKKTHPFMMARKSNLVRGKAKRREENARKKNRMDKKMFRGKVKR